jgi:hypothetical protein
MGCEGKSRHAHRVSRSASLVHLRTDSPVASSSSAKSRLVPITPILPVANNFSSLNSMGDNTPIASPICRTARTGPLVIPRQSVLEQRSTGQPRRRSGENTDEPGEQALTRPSPELARGATPVQRVAHGLAWHIRSAGSLFPNVLLVREFGVIHMMHLFYFSF